MKKIGLFGGTFDPIHNLHLRIAKTAKSELELDEVIFIPTGNPPHKDNNRVSDFVHRSNMVKIAIADIPEFSISEIENNEIYKKSFTSDTLDALSSLYKEDLLYFIVGSDSLFDIESWKNPQNIFEKAIIVVFNRPNISAEKELMERIAYLKKKYDARIEYVKIIEEALSSTQIRNDLIDGELDFPGIILPEVEAYIKEHRLYDRSS